MKQAIAGQSLGWLGWCRATQQVLFVLCYSLDTHAHHHAQGGVSSHGKVVPVVPQADGVQPVFHGQTAGQVEEAPAEGCLGEPGSRTEGLDQEVLVLGGQAMRSTSKSL